MSKSDAAIIRESLRRFRKKEIEAQWEALNTPDAARYTRLWTTLHELGVTGGVALDAASRFETMSELGGASPALAMGLCSHVIAQALLSEAASGALSGALAVAVSDSRFALIGSPLDRAPDASFDLRGDDKLELSGRQRVAWPHPDWIVVPARQAGALRLCVLAVNGGGISFLPTPSSHGLCLMPFGELVLERVPIARAQVWQWPRTGHTAAVADGLVTALICGIIDELAERAMAYALQRYQGGKMIHEHDAVQQLVAPIELSRRVLKPLALSVLSQTEPGDGGASAFAVEIARQAGLDAVQTFGGYGYMEDYRVERYLRDVNTLETFWIHAEARGREIARNRFARMAS